jgi:DNA-binding transcriptional LysR family regulator
MPRLNNALENIRVRDMQVLVMLSNGMRQTEVAEAVGLAQSHISKLIRKLEGIYGVKLANGERQAFRITKEGTEIAKKFKEALIILGGY